ncbi:MAG: XisI protein [Plectolyngbya sp. WJT66-NPBG17]|jgi:hypothetical protein|nr:XisI protein [Plectolyngbya sp. WJT66-NPBG17]
MDRTIEKYRQLIQTYLSDYVSTPIANGEIESYTVFDTQQDHYQVMNLGWDGYRRVYGCVLHLGIRDRKIWVQQNMTERQVAHDLMAMRVPREDIVLGFQAPTMRADTGFGVA